MASGLIKIGKKRGLESAQEKAETERPGALSRLGRARDTEKNRGGIPGAIGYLGGNVVTGAGQMVEGIVDVGMAGADLLRGDTDMAQYRFLKNVTKEWDEELERSYNPGTVMQIGGDVASGIGTSLMYMIPKAGIFLGAAGTFGSNVSEAAEKTGEVGLKELGYAATATVPEVALEGLIGAGVRGGKALFSAGSKALTKGTAKAGVKTVGKAATKVSKSLLGHVALETAKGMAGEGAEEAITEAIDPFLLRLFKIDENAQLDMGNVLYAGLIGSLSGGLMTSGPAAINYKSSQAAGRMIREAGLTDAFLEETRELLGGADRAKTKAEAAKGEKVTAADGSGVIGKVTAMGKNTVNTVRQSKIASSAKRIAETTRKNLQSFEQFNAKENKTAQEQAIADAMLGELRGNVYLLETSYLSETYEQAILDATPEQKQDIVDFINKSMAAKNAAKSDYTVADLDADTDGILTSMAAKYVEGDLERYMGIRRVDTMEGRGQKATETAEEAAQGTNEATAEEVAAHKENAATEATEAEAPDPWESVEGIEGFGTQNKQEEDLLRAASTWGVPKRTVPAMLKSFREGTDLTPSEFAEAWGDGVMFFGRLGLNESAIDKDSPLARTSENTRRASIQEGKTIADEELKRAKEKADKKKMPARNQADAKRKQEGRGAIVKGKGLIVQDLDSAQYTAYKAAEMLAPVLGTDIVIETDLKTDTGKQINGFYSTKTNRMHININAKRDGQSIALYTLGHEVTHYIKEWSPEKFKALSDFVMEHLGNKAPDLIAAKAEFLRKMPDYKDYTVTQLNDLAVEEVVADSMELVLSDGKILDELARTEKTVWQKIKDFITKIIADIRKYYGALNQASKTAQVLKETVESLEEIERLFTEGVREAGERTRTAGVENTLEDNGSPTRKYLISEEIPSTLSAEDQNLLFDADFYERYENESREPITETVEELEAAKASEAFATMSDDEAFDLNAKLKAKRAGYNTVYDYYVETEKERMAEEYRRYVQTGRSNRTSRTLEEKRKKAQKERTLRSDVDSATPLQNAQYQIIQETNPMWDEYHTGIRSPKEIKTFAEVAEDPDSFTWGDFTREDARKALRDGTVRVYSSYAIKNGVFVSTSYKQALGYAGNDPAHVHSRVVALDSVAWINGDEGQYAKVYKDDGIRYSIDDNSLVEKYPTLNLNQDISNMDGVPAIQLEDGSVLTFTEPHVTFIQNSGIDVEDIRSGGWIADGVYEPSERSDTLRYKERMLAKKRMDEKRAAKKGDIRYSIDETPDTAYLAAVERGDMVTAQKMVDEAAKEAGYTVKAHHGTRAEFTVFSKDAIGSGATLFASQGKGFYFAADKATATKYARGGKVLSVCLRLEKPFVFKNKRNKEVNKLLNEFAERYGQTFDIKDYDGFVDFEKRTGTVLSRIVGGNGETFTNFLQSKGYDGIEYVSFDYDTRTGIECYVVFDSQNIKSADPVTYDDNGNVIPLSERFKESKSDIRYSIDETPETPDVSENRDLTDREILGMALEGAVQSQEEYNIVKSYREQASMLELVKEKRNGYSKEAAALERQIKALRSRMEEEGDPNGFIRKALDEAIAKKRNAEAMRDEQDRILDNSTKELLKLKAAKPFRELIDREGRRAKAAERKAAKAVESADAKVERTKQRADRRIEQAKAEYESREKYKDDRREVTTRKRAAQRILGSLNTALYNPTKAKHVPLQLHDLVETTLKSADPKQFGINRDHIREMSGLAAEIEKLERKAALTGEEQETLNKMKGRYEHLEADTISVKRQAEALNTAFKKYQQQVTEADMMDKDLMDALDGYVAEIEEATLAEMNLKSLIAVERFYTALLHQVNNSNKTFATEKAVAIDKLGTDANTEVKEVKALKFLQPRAMELAGLAGVRGFFWNNMKPLTVFDAIGSETFAKLFKNVMDGEDVWATDLEEAHEFLKKAKKEYGYDKWDLKKRSEITTADGTKVALTLGEKMSLYAYMFREQAEEHLSIGGFTFAPNAKTVAAYKDGKIKYEAVLNDQKQYHMRKEDIVKMAESLTEEQRAYAEAVQKYLTRLGKKGNEVSVKLYGLELFNETAYFPIKSNRDYLAASTGKSGDPNIKSRGTFKETVPDASNPIVLEDFMEVTTNHINTMATYHAFVLPIEDLTRVWNYTPVNIKRDENGEAILDENGMPVADTDGAAGYNSLKAEITKKYGAEANDYILQLIRDLNGGARRDAAATILDKGLTAFKRAATTMSASTIIQQPTSVIRAMAYVDAKHFSGASITPWETVKKYAKVAFIKEMGGHDINTGARTQEFLNQREYDNLGQKVKAAVTPEVYGGDPQARAEFFGWLTSKADEKTWCFLFGAVVNEQAERLGKPKDSEEVLKAAGERFTEVVRRTQVYDSTLTRSQYMRSKDGLMKMATSFMAEPTTVVSMAADAIIRLERGDKMFIRKTAAGIAGSIILNAMAVSLVYAMRDDDEEKNYLEKYISSLTGEIVEGLNPLEYFPILRDIMSLFKGYEVERSDMTLINNLLEQVEMITSSKRSFMDKMIGVTGAVAAFFGIPVTNLYRDVKGLTTTTISLFNGEPMTAKGTASAALEGVTDQFGLFKKLLGGDRGTSYELYRAKVSGDNSHYTRVAARYDSPEAEEQALRRELRENDKRIGEAAEARRSGDIEVYKSLVEQITDEGIFDRGMVIRAIQTEMNALSRETEKGTVVPKDTEVADEETVEVVSLYSSSDLNAALERGDTEDFKEILDSMISDRVQAGKTEAQAKSAVKSSITAYWKPRYIEARNANDAETMKKILQILLASGLYGSRNDVAVMLEGWIKAYAKSK